MTKRKRSRGSGWSEGGIGGAEAGWASEPQRKADAPPPPPLQAKPYSYLDSAGYCECALKMAQKLTGRNDIDFSDLFDANGKAHSSLNTLDVNQRAALKEISRTPRERLIELGVIKE